MGAGLKELPIRKLALMALVGFLAVFLLDGYKSEELGKVEADLAKVTTEQNQLRAEVAKTKGYEELKKALDGDDVDGIKAKTDGRIQASHKLSEAVYLQAQQQQASGGDGSGASSADENVEEGDYEVVDED